MKILITGATGLIGTQLQERLRERGHDLLLASRREPKDASWAQWDYDSGFAEPKQLDGLDAVVHLAGENISGLRWTDEKKRLIKDSRVLGTRNVVDTISGLNEKPKTLIAASAIGFYG